MSIIWRTSSGGTAGSGDYLYSLPAGVAFSSSVAKYTGSSYQEVGRAIGYTSLSQNGFEGLGAVIPYNDTQFRIIYSDASGNTGFQSPVAYPLGMNLALHATFTAPIQGWSGSQAVQVGSRFRLAERFGDQMTRVTTMPRKLGEYRSYNRVANTQNGVDTALQQLQGRWFLLRRPDGIQIIFVVLLSMRFLSVRTSIHQSEVHRLAGRRETFSHQKACIRHRN